MNELDVNGYIVASEEVLNDDPIFKSYFNALVEERTRLAENGCNSGNIEGILFSIWNQRIGYIIDHLDEIRTRMS